MGPDKLAAIELFMEHYCRVMARIVNEWGRLDKFMSVFVNRKGAHLTIEKGPTSGTLSEL